MADGSIIIDTHIDNKEAQKELASLKKSMQKLSGSLEAKKSQQSAIAQEMHQADAAIEETHQNIKRLEAELKTLQGVDLKNVSSGEYLGAQLKIPEVQAELERQRAVLEQQGQAADKVAARYDKVSGEVSQITAELEKATDRAGYLAQQVTGVGRGARQAAKDTGRASREMRKFRRRIIELTKSALLFSVLTKALTVMRNWLGKTVASSEEASAAISALKGSLQGLAAPILNAVIPALIKVVQFLTQIISLIGRGVSALFGMTNKQALESAKNLNEQQEALEGVGGAASDAEKQLASFDEINKLTEPGGGGGGGADNLAPTFEEVELPEWLEGTANKLADALDRLRTVWDKFKKNPAVQYVFDAIKSFLKSVAKTSIDGVTNSINVLSSLMEFIDALTTGDPVYILDTMLRLLGDIAYLLADPALDLAEWVLSLFGVEVDLEKWWNDKVKPWFTAEKHFRLWSDAKKGWENGWNDIREWWDNSGLVKWWRDDVKPWFTKARWQQLLQEAKTGVSDGWSEFKTWWNSTISEWWNNNVAVWFTREKWSSVMGGIKEAFRNSFTDAANAAIGVLNRMIAWINDRLKFNVPQLKWTNPFTGNIDTLWEAREITIARLPDIPYLAQGAVIPPNREFMAVLGDQKSGTNIETPLSTMVQAFRQALNERGGGSRTIVLELDRRELGRVTFDVYNEEADRVGVVLGGA